MVIKLRVVQFWSEIILVIANRTRAARSFDFEITSMISDQIALHSVQLPLFINNDKFHRGWFQLKGTTGLHFTNPKSMQILVSVDFLRFSLL